MTRQIKNRRTFLRRSLLLAAAWVFNGKLFMTGGKYSYTQNGEIKFVYSNDVWAMSRKTQ